MCKRIAIFMAVLFLFSVLPLNDSSSLFMKDKKTSHVSGLNSNYTIELKTNALELNRAQYLSYQKTDYGIKTLNYDDYDNTWYYREINNGTWTEIPISYEVNDNEDWMNIRFVLTDFGLFKMTVGGGTINCPSSFSAFRISSYNYSNSTEHADFQFCSIGYAWESSLNIASFDFGFSFSLLTSNPGTGQYKDNLITIFQNGSYENRQMNVRAGTQTFGSFTGERVRVITTNNLSCFEMSDLTGTSGTEKVLTKCYNHEENTEFQERFCRVEGTGKCERPPVYIKDNNDLIILDTDLMSSNSYENNFYRINGTGIYNLNLNWQPDTCRNINQLDNYNVKRHIFVVYDYFFCHDPDGLGSSYEYLWNPINNITTDFPTNDFINTNWAPKSAISFDSGINTTQTNWLLTYSLRNVNGKEPMDYGILWSDLDRDGVKDSIDIFPYDSSQHSDNDGDGYGDSFSGNLPDSCPSEYGNSTIDRLGCSDFDGDGWSDTRDYFPNDRTQWNDSDFDGYGDNYLGNFPDSCPQTFGESTEDGYGCMDSDGDGWSDFSDSFDFDSSQWNDSDNDGFGDLLIGFQGDSCPEEIGNSTLDVFGCLDSDGDGWSDDGDDLPQNPTQWIDRDGDGYGENSSEGATEIDLFPSDGSQWNDTDNDGHGDNPYGTQGDWFPDDPTRWQDSDRDSSADEDDAFPNDVTQQVDSDGDGYGDNIDGNRGDVFPDDPLEWKDSDGDGLGDNADMFPYDPTQTEDRDGDGMGDNPMGIGADKFPDDPTQWGDIDGDGYGDNPLGNNPDVFITDATQWFDEDGDGYGDNPTGRLYDQFPQNPTQWEDADEDGLGDNQSGTDADPFLNDFDNDGYNDSIDILPKLASPGDLDADGCLDEVDAFPSDSQECIDTDGDGVGNNADSDDDGDGWTDADEERVGTDSLSASDQPVDSFEIVIPGTAVGLGAWDLIGIFGGVPLFAWIGFGFATRNGRCARYEELLKEATSRDELEQVALRWEYSLMLRMLGPHQGIRLERLRAELDDKFENATYDEDDIGFDQTSIVENEGKDIPPINESFTGPTKETAATSTDESGYEWFKQGEENWYRPAGSEDEWFKF